MHKKYFNVWKLSSLLILTSLLIVACPSPLINSYYIQQQNESFDNIFPDPNPDQDIEDEGLVMPPLPGGKLNAFWVILRDGIIAEPKNDNAAHTQFEGKLGSGYNFSTSKFDDWKFKAKFNNQNVPEMQYDGTTTWVNDKYDGENSTAQGYTISSMKYYRYVGKNPFGLYKNEKYPVYNTEGKPTGEKEALMARFVFYRFTGTVPVAGGLNNYIVAVDMYSKLVFAFAKPTGFTNLGVPTGWEPVDTAAEGKTDSNGRKYRFYEYDPAGYVTADGTFHMTDAYKNNLANKKYIPDFNEKSPYVGCGGTALNKKGLAVKAKYLKNISVTDGLDWKDGVWSPNYKPEFTWDIRSRAYSEDTPSNWDSLEKQVANLNYKIEKDMLVNFFEDGKTYSFTDKKAPYVLELDSEIIEIDGNTIDSGSNDWVTKYEKPIICFKYDTDNKMWKPNGTKGQGVNGAVSFDANFTLTDGETKEFVITLPAGSGEKMELCYELSWKAK